MEFQGVGHQGRPDLVQRLNAIKGHEETGDMKDMHGIYGDWDRVLYNYRLEACCMGLCVPLERAGGVCCR